jgi:hypothetical protein
MMIGSANSRAERSKSADHHFSISNQSLWLWIPGPRQEARPGMTTERGLAMRVSSMRGFASSFVIPGREQRE